MRWTHATVGILVSIVAVASFLLGRWSARPAQGACPEMDGVDPALAALDDGALERRLRERAASPPAMVAQQLATIRANAEAAGPARRACVLRSTLARAIAAADQMKRTTPGLWGLDHPSDELRKMILTRPLLHDWTEADRADVIAQLEALTITRLAGRGPDELEHWRRRYYGLLLACEAKDEVLAQLGALRATECPRLAPRRPAP